MEGKDITSDANLPLLDIRLQAVSKRPSSFFGSIVAYAPLADGGGTEFIAVSARLDDVAGDDAGALMLLPIPE